MGVRIKRASRLIIIIIHKLKALLLNKFLLNLARHHLSFVQYYGGESVHAASHYGTWALLIGSFIDSQKPYACRCSAQLLTRCLIHTGAIHLLEKKHLWNKQIT